MWVQVADSAPTDFLDAYSRLLDIRFIITLTYNYQAFSWNGCLYRFVLFGFGDSVTSLHVDTAIFCYQLSEIMELGISVAIYLVLSLVFLSLICILPKYFHYKMKTVDPNLAGSEMMTEELQSHSSLEEEEDSNQYAFGTKEKSRAKSPFFNNTKYEIELEDEKQMPREIFEGSTLMKKLNNQLAPLKSVKPLTKSSLKEIKAAQLVSTKFTNSRLTLNESQKSQVFKFVSKLVSYEQDTITVIEVDMRSIKKDEANNIIENKKIENYQVKLKEEGEEAFGAILKGLNLELHQHGAFKVITKVQINDMAKNAQYQLRSLKTSENTEWISENQFKKQEQTIITYI